MRPINSTGFQLIAEFEGKELTAYLCPAGVWTIGYGHTGPDVREGDQISDKRAVELLNRDLDGAEDCVSKVCPATSDNEFAALVSLAFNIGAEGFRKSTVARLHNKGDKVGAAGAFSMWNKATVNGKLTALAGLTRRRGREADLYLTPDRPPMVEQRMPQAVEPPKSVASSKSVVTGAVGAVAAAGAVADQITPAVNAIENASAAATGAATAMGGVKAALASLIDGRALPVVLTAIAVGCIVFVVWRYVIKARRGDVVST
jgi:lysozyme